MDHRSVMVLDRPRYELLDTESDTAIWVRKIPDPARAAELLARYGVPAEEADTMDPATAPFPPPRAGRRGAIRAEGLFRLR